MVEPPVCVPMESGTWKSATEAADPAEEPPEEKRVSCGLPVAALRPAAANSVVSVLPRMMAPSARRRSTTAASWPAGGLGNSAS